MAIAFQSVQTNNSIAATSLVVTKPVSTVSGDLLIASITIADGGAITLPAGWALIQTQDNSGKVRLSVAYKVATGSEPANYTWTWGTSTSCAGNIIRYTGADTISPIGTSSIDNGGSNKGTTYTALSITTTAANSFVYASFGIKGTNSLSNPAGMTSRSDASGLRVSDVLQATIGASGNKVSTNGNEDWEAALVEIKELVDPLAPVIQSFSTATADTSSSLTITKPTGTVAGNLLVGITFSEHPNMTIPAGWTLLRKDQTNVASIDEGTLYITYKIADGAEPASYTWSGADATDEHAGGILRVTNYSTTRPFGNTSSAIGLSSTATATTITTTKVSSLLVYAAGLEHTNSYAAATPGMGQLWSVASVTTPLDQGVTSTVSTEIRPTAVATGSRSAVSPISDYWVADLIEIRGTAPGDARRLLMLGVGI